MKALWYVGHLRDAVGIWLCSLTGSTEKLAGSRAERVWGTTSYSPRERYDQTKRRWSITKSSITYNWPKIKESLLRPNCQIQKRAPRKQGKCKQGERSGESQKAKWGGGSGITPESALSYSYLIHGMMGEGLSDRKGMDDENTKTSKIQSLNS